MEMRNFLVITDLTDQHGLRVDSDLFVKYPVPEEKEAVRDQTQTFILPTTAQFSHHGPHTSYVCYWGVSVVPGLSPEPGLCRRMGDSAETGLEAQYSAGGTRRLEQGRDSLFDVLMLHLTFPRPFTFLRSTRKLH